MAKAMKIPEIAEKTSSFCPGCGHGIVIRLITECLEELGQDKNIIFGLGVGCSSLLGGVLETDRLHCLHGRAGAVCTGMKRVSPDNVVIAYQGDGDAYSIGLAETTSAAYRNENFTVITVNNTNYGMTGGQMSNTTMPGQKTTTSPKGRDCSVTGNPIKFPELVADQFDAAYAARGAVNTPVNIKKVKGYIKNALEAQINGEGYSVVEILSPCPTNWGMTALKAMERVEKELIPYYPLGEFKKREAK
ncbi:2-oxoglutarate ferredoxin oxidoreductase subunit beta [Peptoclostridium litorale DSM 5388]|uniref:Ketoisovalerate oxidoreductase subunit VorA n=1 Tax=Peptoclostridium litorale DSM 5388 TaxID=1121324 RepID=A0A069RI56_PEPLI|nr:thiamine pyrophosphate-dependent enzyme [Peptoclostridium litorale]KDR96478.1 ketoisovalerate oxidoreductase subunit VorA [Peptoclostridium litorale DSM 5388]SIN70126.1 2-oxoglutarate ferredoxin oxidoreductase subunit beta [Peptoclostridium litorale DSM 5388]